MKRNIIIFSVLFMLFLALNSVHTYTEKNGNVSGQTWAAGTYLVTGSLSVDVNDPIDAPKAGYYVNTIDSAAPTSNVKTSSELSQSVPENLE
ncbi:hypothetical protein FJZ33_11250 [Candidatus Poribacteria bacterium]|nr:hypothetical protein [Candidatus Poribacteria bacterium]